MKYLLGWWFWGSFCTWHASWDVVAYAEMQSLSFIKRKGNFSRYVLSARSLFVKWSTGPTVYYIPSWRIKKYSRPISNDIVELYNSKQARKNMIHVFLFIRNWRFVCWQYCLLAILVHVVVWKWVPQLRFNLNTQFEAQVRTGEHLANRAGTTMFSNKSMCDRLPPTSI